MKLVFSIYLWFFYGLSFAVSFPLIVAAYVITYPFDKERLLANRIFMFFGQSFVRLNPFWKVEIEGLENVKKGRNGTIFVGNHQSFLDMPLVATLPWKMKWVSKKELFKIPVAGWIMKMSGHVSIDRGSKTAVGSLYGIMKYINAGVPVMVYPEGTRSRDGTLKPFKRGTFIIAKEYDIPIQPIIVHGTHNVMKPGTWKISKIRGTIKVTIGEIIKPDHFDTEKELRDVTHDVFARELSRMASET